MKLIKHGIESNSTQQCSSSIISYFLSGIWTYNIETRGQANNPTSRYANGQLVWQSDRPIIRQII